MIIQANELERLVTWYNPLSRSDLLIPGEDDIATWRSQNVSEKQYRELARLAWDISPELALFLPDRLTTHLFLLRVSTAMLMHNVDIAFLSVCSSSVCLYVRLSVTFWYRIEVTQLIIVLSSAYGSLIALHCESQKLDSFTFEHNFGKYCPIFAARCYALARPMSSCGVCLCVCHVCGSCQNE